MLQSELSDELGVNVRIYNGAFFELRAFRCTASHRDRDQGAKRMVNIRRALEEAGVEFIPAKGGRGVGVRLRAA
jgi:hypothetical protein